MLLSLFLTEQRGIGEYIGTVRMIRRWYENKSSVPAEEMAFLAGITVPQFQGIVSLIENHPEWDDEMIADRADWRQ